jgi:2-amino-4-hydroxy-6-hydroxymethyldihydropteridine diphosphokinase
LPELGVGVSQRSAWYCTEPVPRSDQPWFVNGVASLATTLSPAALLAELLALEHRFGRVRGAVNAARVLDLDLLDYDGMVVDGDSLILPHPRLHQRRFVLAPLAELAPNWTHPLLRRTASELLVLLPPGDTICRLPG